jgi:hypothetical protein
MACDGHTHWFAWLLGRCDFHSFPFFSKPHTYFTSQGLKLKYIDDFKELMQVVDPKDGYIQYWTHFKAAEAPGIPFYRMIYLRSRGTQILM